MNSPQPSKYALRLLRWFCREDFLEEIEGDLWEMFEIRQAHQPRLAHWYFFWNVIRAFRPINFKKTQYNNWTTTMVKNYTKVYFRRFRRETSHYLVNILGLSLGFMVLFFILMFVYDEQNIDGFHKNKERAYRVIYEYTNEDGVQRSYSTPGPLAAALQSDFSSIEKTAQMTSTGSQVIGVGDRMMADREWAIASTEIFDILDIHIIEGNVHAPINGQAGVILTEGLAKRIFNSTDVIGKRVEESRFGPAEVIAVMTEMPRNSSYRFSNIYVPNYSQWPDFWQQYMLNWDGRFSETWVLLKEGTSPEQITAQSKQFLSKYMDTDEFQSVNFSLQRVDQIHLSDEDIIRGGMSPRLSIPTSDPQFVSMILLLGFLVIFIATLNYINLSSVQALKRTLEASMRKINGALNKHLLGQLFFETLLTVVFSYLLSLLLVLLCFPYFQSIAHKDFGIDLLFTEDFIIYHVASIFIIWMVSALLPAFYYARLKRSLLVVKNAFSGKGDQLRKVLVAIQYALSIFLIVGSLVIYQQLQFVQNKNLGFDNKKLIILDINSGAARSNFNGIIEGIKTHSNVVNATTSSRVPGEWKNLPTVELARNFSDESVAASHYGVDHEWLSTFQMKISEGKNFSGNAQLDSLHILINQRTVELLELSNPIGASLWVMNQNDSVKMKVIGVLEDFHFQSLYDPIGPMVLTSWNNHIRSIDYFAIRYDNNPQEVIAHIEKVNASFDPGTPPEINFLDEQWKRYYLSEQSRANILLVASILSILISAFGLFGLINYTVARKTKEIGIRKVMGASPQSILQLILKDYLMLMLLSLVVAAPVSWWIFSNWLADFAYRITMTPLFFVSAFFIVLFISLATLTSRIYRVTQTDPVKAIRYE